MNVCLYELERKIEKACRLKHFLNVVPLPLSFVCPAVFPRPGCWSLEEQSSLSQPNFPSTRTLPETETNRICWLAI